MSGQYEELKTSLGWYTDSNYTNKIELNSNGLPIDGVTSDLNLYAKAITFVLKKGSDFNKLISSTATSVIFTDEIMPISATLIDVDENGDGGVVAWMDGTSMKVSTQIKGLKAQANPDIRNMFYNKRNLRNIDLTMLDTQNVTYMNTMFYNCSGLTSLDLTPLDTQNVTDMGYMLYDCSSLTTLDLTSMNTQKVTDMDWVFGASSKLTTLSLGDKFAFVSSDYSLPSGTWYSSDGTSYTSNGTTCTIPNNKADTYTRR